MISVRVENLVKKFNGVLALDHVNISIKPGELFFILGPSGCGKTTMLRTLAGFYTPDSGRILFDDDDVSRLEPHKRNTGMVFQSYALWPHKTVSENVAFGLEQQKIPKTEIRRRVGEALESVQMESFANRKPNELSGGQQQRIALARALVIRPRCLLLDEPLSNLDAKLRNEMRLEIRRICKEHKLTTIYVTHDQKEALSIADYMVVLSWGRVKQIGSPLEVYKRPANRFVANFIGEANFIEGTVVRTGAGEALVATAIGEFRGALANYDFECKEGSKVYLCIRPECWHLDLTGPDENCIVGRIDNATYFGEVAHYDFRAGDTVLKISEINPRHMSSIRHGQLHAWVDAEDVVVMAE
ncbi:MAG TPA: ABC transporter ATP-binding protein [Opitutales bacterium]|nr:ABC transporter ATP-binding protein [Opitutales bacterium]